MKNTHIIILTLLGLASGIVSSVYYHFPMPDLIKQLYEMDKLGSIVPGLVFGVVLAVFFFWIGHKEERAGIHRHLLFILASILAFIVAWWIAMGASALIAPYSIYVAGIPAGAVGGLVLALSLRIIKIKLTRRQVAWLVFISAALGSLLFFSLKDDLYASQNFPLLLVGWQTSVALTLGILLRKSNPSSAI